MSTLAIITATMRSTTRPPGGDHELIIYLVEQGGDIRAVSRRGQTVADLANGPVQRVSPLPATVALLEKLGSANSHRCLTC